MAEYNDVIKHFNRMCGYYNDKATQNGCPIYCKGHGCNISHCCVLAFEDKNFAKVVMAWAAEHPEPVFPTWGEWFVSMGMLSDEWDSTYSPFRYVGYLPSLMRTPIPADIAEKLGIQAKGVR